MYVTCVNTFHVILLIDDYVMDIYLCYDYVYMDIIWFNGFRCIIHTHHVKFNLIDNLIQNDFKFLKGNVFTPPLRFPQLVSEPGRSNFQNKWF